MDKSLILFGFNITSNIATVSLEAASKHIEEIIDFFRESAESKIDSSAIASYGQIHPIEFEVYKASSGIEVIGIGTFAFECNDIETFRKMKLMVSERRATEIKKEVGLYELVYYTKLNMSKIPDKNDHIIQIRYNSHLKTNDKRFNTFYNVNKHKAGNGFTTVL
jgi:23S rRNA maturation mini-RNase III